VELPPPDPGLINKSKIGKTPTPGNFPRAVDLFPTPPRMWICCLARDSFCREISVATDLLFLPSVGPPPDPESTNLNRTIKTPAAAEIRCTADSFSLPPLIRRLCRGIFAATDCWWTWFYEVSDCWWAWFYVALEHGCARDYGICGGERVAILPRRTGTEGHFAAEVAVLSSRNSPRC
jgi:hypothetical protein